MNYVSLRRTLLVVPLTLAILAVVACTSDDPAPTATTTTDASPTTVGAASGSPVATATTRAPFILQTPTPFATPEAMAPDRILETNARRTGVPEVDRVLDALFGGDQAALDALVLVQSAVCHEESLGVGDMEVCPKDVEEGTRVEFFSAGGCEGAPQHARPFVTLFDPEAIALFAVVTLPPADRAFPYWPPADQLVVFVTRQDPPFNAIALTIVDGKIATRSGGCGNTASDLLARDSESPDYLLEPFPLPEISPPE